MTAELKNQIRGLLGVCRQKLSDEQFQEVFDGWDAQFRRLGVLESDQQAEFNTIMKIRVRAGMVSVMPDQFRWSHKSGLAHLNEG